MKKVMLTILFMLAVSKVHADDIFLKTLTEHVTTVTQFKSGETKLALMDSVLLIGKINGSSVLDIQAGFSGNTRPEAGKTTAADVTAGVFFKVSSLIRGRVQFPPEWTFLNSIEHGPFFNYDFREHRSLGGYQVGLAFTLNPVK